MRPTGRRAATSGLLSIAMLGLVACSASETAQTGTPTSQFDAEAYFSGKTIRLVTSSGSGGGTDTLARLIAGRIGDFIPGNPNVVPSNVTPHVAGMNFVWNAPKDGTVMAFDRFSPLEFELFEGSEFNAVDFRYLGSFDAACGDTLLIRGNLGYDSIEDIRGSKSPELVAITQAPDPSSVEPATLGLMLAAEWLDLPLEMNTVAETGLPVERLAMKRGDINSILSGAGWCRLPNLEPGWLEDKYAFPVLDMNPGGPAAMPSVIDEMGLRPPHVTDMLTEEQSEKWAGFVEAPRAGGRSFYLPPGTPDHIYDTLRKAYLELTQDSQFRKKAVEILGGGEVFWLDANEQTQLIEESSEALHRVDDEIEEVSRDMYDKYVE